MDTALLNRITTNQKIFGGKPIIMGKRMSVEHILKMLARGISHQDIFAEYPFLVEDDIKACLLFAVTKISTEEGLAA